LQQGDGFGGPASLEEVVMEFTTPEGRTYIVADELLADGGASFVAAVVQLDRDGITDDGRWGRRLRGGG
jgi:hypothetical protein